MEFWQWLEITIEILKWVVEILQTFATVCVLVFVYGYATGGKRNR